MGLAAGYGVIAHAVLMQWQSPMDGAAVDVAVNYPTPISPASSHNHEDEFPVPAFKRQRLDSA